MPKNAHYMYQVWKLGDIGSYPIHTDDPEQAIAHFEDPSTQSIDINMGIGKRVTVRNMDDFEEFHQQLEELEPGGSYVNQDPDLRHEPYEVTMKRLSREDQELADKLRDDPKIARMCEASGKKETPVKAVDNSHRLDTIDMCLVSCQTLVNKIADEEDDIWENISHLQMQIEFIGEQVKKIREDK